MTKRSVEDLSVSPPGLSLHRQWCPMAQQWTAFAGQTQGCSKMETAMNWKCYRRSLTASQVTFQQAVETDLPWAFWIVQKVGMWNEVSVSNLAILATTNSVCTQAQSWISEEFRRQGAVNIQANNFVVFTLGLSLYQINKGAVWVEYGFNKFHELPAYTKDSLYLRI